MNDIHTRNKAILAPLRASMVDFEAAPVRAALADVMAPEAIIHMPHPLGDMAGPGAGYKACCASFICAFMSFMRCSRAR